MGISSERELISRRDFLASLAVGATMSGIRWQNGRAAEQEVSESTGEIDWPSNLEKLAIFYAHPDLVNNTGSVKTAIETYSNFHHVVFGANLVLKNHSRYQDHPKHDVTELITRVLTNHEYPPDRNTSIADELINYGIDDIGKINRVLPRTNVYLYVNLGYEKDKAGINDHSTKELSWRIRSCANMGADGTFFDGASPTYFVDKIRMKRVIDECAANEERIKNEIEKAYKFRAFVNSDTPSWVKRHDLLREGDLLLLAPFYISEGSTENKEGVEFPSDNPYDPWATDQGIKVCAGSTCNTYDSKEVNAVLDAISQLKVNINVFSLSDPGYGGSTTHLWVPK
jgi:hypothetical protein